MPISVITPTADNLILAGDIGHPTDENYARFLEYVTSNWKKVIYVPGNHEYYDVTGVMTMERVNNVIREFEKKYKNLYCLIDNIVKIEGIIFIGSTLWSHPAFEDKLNDFRMNIFDEEGCITLERFRNLNAKCIEFLETAMKQNSPDDKVVVITHFLPLKQSDIINSKYRSSSEMDSYLGNKLYHLINKANVWISGHTHERFEMDYKGTKWLCNAYGQLFEKMQYKSMTFTI